MNEIKLNDKQLVQLEAMHQETGLSYEELLNAAVHEFFVNFMAELRRSEIKPLK